MSMAGSAIEAINHPSRLDPMAAEAGADIEAGHRQKKRRGCPGAR